MQVDDQKASEAVKAIDHQLILNYNNISLILNSKTTKLRNELKSVFVKTGNTLSSDFKDHQVLAAVTFAEMNLEIYEVELQMDHQYMKRNQLLEKSIKAYTKFVEDNNEKIATWK